MTQLPGPTSQSTHHKQEKDMILMYKCIQLQLSPLTILCIESYLLFTSCNVMIGDQPIMLIYLPIMLCCSVHKFDPLCSAHVYQTFSIKYIINYYIYACAYDYKGCRQLFSYLLYHFYNYSWQVRSQNTCLHNLHNSH